MRGQLDALAMPTTTLDFHALFQIPAARPTPNCDWQAQNPSHVILHPGAPIHRAIAIDLPGYALVVTTNSPSEF
jgi:hypothetical protein